MGKPLGRIPATIPDGDDEVEVDLEGLCPVRMFTDTAFDGTSLTFLFTDNGTDWYPLKDENDTAIAYTVSAGGCYRVTPADFASVTRVKIKSDANQSGAASTVALWCRLVD